MITRLLSPVLPAWFSALRYLVDQCLSPTALITLLCSQHLCRLLGPSPYSIAGCICSIVVPFSWPCCPVASATSTAYCSSSRSTLSFITEHHIHPYPLPPADPVLSSLTTVSSCLCPRIPRTRIPALQCQTALAHQCRSSGRLGFESSATFTIVLITGVVWTLPACRTHSEAESPLPFAASCHHDRARSYPVPSPVRGVRSRIRWRRLKCSK